MELCAHDIMIMARQNGNAVTTLPVPDANRLVVRGANYPGIFMVEEDGANIIQVAVQCEEAATRFVIPDFDLVIVAAAHEKGLRCVEGDATDGTWER